MSAAVNASPLYLVTACVAPLLSNRTGSVPVVPVGIAWVISTYIVPLYHAFTKAWLGKENTTLAVLTVTPEVDSRRALAVYKLERIYCHNSLLSQLTPKTITGSIRIETTIQAVLVCYTVGNCRNRTVRHGYGFRLLAFNFG